MTKAQFEVWVAQEQELTRRAITIEERRHPEFADLRAKIDRIKLQRFTRPSWLRERLTPEEVSFLLQRDPGRSTPGLS